MDSQFNKLVSSYSDNYIQYKITGGENYKSAYDSAKQGLDTIISKTEEEVKSGNDKISSFYKSGIEQKMAELDSANKQLQRGITVQRDDLEAAKLRGVVPSNSVSTWQYITLGVLGATILGLSLF